MRRFLDVEHRLILQSCVVGEEVVPPAVGRDAGAGEVVESREASDERITPRSIECCSCEPVLRLDPGDGFGRVWIFEPPIWIGHTRAVIAIGDVSFVSSRVRIHAIDMSCA